MVIAPFPWDAEERYVVDGKTYTVHPLAQLFPLMRGEEFDRLVEDVKTHGLRRPILVTGPGANVIVDGRNRLRAAIEAGVTPVFEQLADNANLPAVIYTENVRRRHMTQGQLAILGALIRRALRQMDPTAGNRDQVRSPFGDPLLADLLAAVAVEGGSDEVDVRGTGAKGRRPTQEDVAAHLSISAPYLRRAERVLEVAADLAKQVWNGALQLNDAYRRCMEHARETGDVHRGSAKATGKGTAQRTGQRRESKEPSASGNSTAIESTSGAEDQQVTETVSTDGKDASHPMPTPSGDGSSQPVPTSAAADTAMRGDEAEWSPESTTPPLVLDGLRLTLGNIDLDPCSSEAAQEQIAAREWYSAAQDGLSLPWHGTVHVFPPTERIDEFAEKLVTELDSGRVRRAALLGPADLRSDWAVHLLEQAAFDALVIERVPRSSEAAGNRNHGMGRLALFLLGVDSDRLTKVFDTWGVTLPSPRSNANHGAEASAARTLTEDRIPQADGSRMSPVNPSPPPDPKSGGTVVGPTTGGDARSTSDQTGDRVPRADQRQAPSAKSEVSEHGIRTGIGALVGMHPGNIFLTDAWLEKAKESKLGKGARRLLDRVQKTTERVAEPFEPSTGTDGGSSARTGAASKDEN